MGVSAPGVLRLYAEVGAEGSPASSTHSPGPVLDVVEEVRLAVVMYGGVSLSIYMNGVAQELYHLVRATAPDRPAGNRALAEDQLTGSERVFRALAQLDPDDLGAALDAVLVQLARLRDEPIPADELGKAKAYAGGRLELRLEETHHLAGWYGVQEALHDEVLELDDALERIDAVTGDQIRELAGRLLVDDRLALAVVAPAGAGTDLEARLKLP